MDIFRLDYSKGKWAFFFFFSQEKQTANNFSRLYLQKLQVLSIVFIDLTQTNCLFPLAENFVSVKIIVWLGLNEVSALQRLVTGELLLISKPLLEKKNAFSVRALPIAFPHCISFSTVFLKYFLLIFLM